MYLSLISELAFNFVCCLKKKTYNVRLYTKLKKGSSFCNEILHIKNILYIVTINKIIMNVILLLYFLQT